MSKLLKTSFFFFLCLIGILMGCDYTAEKRLSDQEKKLAETDSALNLREQQVEINERKLALRERRLDSLTKSRDTSGIYDPKIIGNWKVAMECTETNCTGYAVGDTKTEQWEVSYSNLTVKVSALVNKKVVRTYTGLLRPGKLELTADMPGPNTVIEVALTLDSSNEKILLGQRIINKENECRTVFAIRADKI